MSFSQNNKKSTVLKKIAKGILPAVRKKIRECEKKKVGNPLEKINLKNHKKDFIKNKILKEENNDDEAIKTLITILHEALKISEKDENDISIAQIANITKIFEITYNFSIQNKKCKEEKIIHIELLNDKHSIEKVLHIKLVKYLPQNNKKNHDQKNAQPTSYKIKDWENLLVQCKISKLEISCCNRKVMISQPKSLQKITEDNIKEHLLHFKKLTDILLANKKSEQKQIQKFVAKVKEIDEFFRKHEKNKSFTGQRRLFDCYLNVLRSKHEKILPTVEQVKIQNNYTLKGYIELFCSSSLLVCLCEHRNDTANSCVISNKNKNFSHLKDYTKMTTLLNLEKYNSYFQKFHNYQADKGDKKISKNDSRCNISNQYSIKSHAYINRNNSEFANREATAEKMQEFINGYFTECKYTPQDIMHIVESKGVFSSTHEENNSIKFKTVYSEKFTEKNKKYFIILLKAVVCKYKILQLKDRIKIFKFFNEKGDITKYKSLYELYKKFTQEIMHSYCVSKFSVDDLLAVAQHSLSVHGEKKDTAELFLYLLKIILAKENAKSINAEAYKKIIEFINERSIVLQNPQELQEMRKYFMQLQHNYFSVGITECIENKDWLKACKLISDAEKEEKLINPKLCYESTQNQSVKRDDFKKILVLDKIIADITEKLKVKNELQQQIDKLKSVPQILEAVKKYQDSNKFLKKISDHKKFKEVKEDVLSNKIKLLNKSMLNPDGLTRNVSEKRGHILCILNAEYKKYFILMATQKITETNIKLINQLINCMANLKYSWTFEESQQLAEFVLCRQFAVNQLPENLKDNILAIFLKYTELLFKTKTQQQECEKFFVDFITKIVEFKKPDVFGEFVDKLLMQQNNQSFQLNKEIKFTANLDSHPKIVNKLDNLLKDPEKIQQIRFLIYVLGNQQQQKRYEINCKICEIAESLKDIKNWPEVLKQNITLDVADKAYRDILQKALTKELKNIRKIQNLDEKQLKNLSKLYEHFKMNTDTVCSEILKNLRHLTTEQQLKKGDNAAAILNCYRIINCLGGSQDQKNEINARMKWLLPYFYLHFSFKVKNAKELPCVKNIEKVMTALKLESYLSVVKFKKSYSLFYKAYVLAYFDQMFLDKNLETQNFAIDHIKKLCNLSDLKVNNVGFIDDRTDEFELVVFLLKRRFEKVDCLYKLYFPKRKKNMKKLKITSQSNEASKNENPRKAAVSSSGEKFNVNFEKIFFKLIKDEVIGKCVGLTNLSIDNKKFEQLHMDQVRLLANYVISHFESDMITLVTNYKFYKLLRELVSGKCCELLKNFDKTLLNVLRKDDSKSKSFLSNLIADKDYYNLIDPNYKFFFVFNYLKHDLNNVILGENYDAKFDSEKLKFIISVFPTFNPNDEHKHVLVDNYKLIYNSVAAFEKLMKIKNGEQFLKELPSYSSLKLLMAMIDFAIHRGDQQAKHDDQKSQPLFTKLYSDLYHHTANIIFQFTERCSKLLQLKKAEQFYYMAIGDNIDMKLEYCKEGDGRHSNWTNKNKYEYKILLIYKQTGSFFKKAYIPKKIICKNLLGKFHIVEVESNNKSEDLCNALKLSCWGDKVRDCCLEYVRNHGDLNKESSFMPKYQLSSKKPSNLLSAKYVKLHESVIKSKNEQKQLKVVTYN